MDRLFDLVRLQRQVEIGLRLPGLELGIGLERLARTLLRTLALTRTLATAFLPVTPTAATAAAAATAATFAVLARRPALALLLA